MLVRYVVELAAVQKNKELLYGPNQSKALLLSDGISLLGRSKPSASVCDEPFPYRVIVLEENSTYTATAAVDMPECRGGLIKMAEYRLWCESILQ